MLQLRIPSAFPSSGEGSGGGVRPLSRHHVGNRACVAARPGKKIPPANPSLVTGISWGCLRVVDGNAGTVSSFPARTQSQDMTGSACRFWRGLCVRAGSCPSCVSSSLVHAAPWLAGPRTEGASGNGLSLRTQELESWVAEGSGGGVRPLSRHHVGNRACVAARPERRHPQPTPSLVTGD